MQDELKKVLGDCKDSVSHGFGDGVEFEKGKYVFNSETGKLERWVAPKKVEVHTVIRDEILDGIHSMLDDKVYYSRSAYLNSLKKEGYEVTGGDHLKGPRDVKPPDDAEIRRHTEQAYFDIKYDRVEFTEKQKQLHKEENEVWAALK